MSDVAAAIAYLCSPLAIRARCEPMFGQRAGSPSIVVGLARDARPAVGLPHV
jgi:hypothetical protein